MILSHDQLTFASFEKGNAVGLRVAGEVIWEWPGGFEPLKSSHISLIIISSACNLDHFIYLLYVDLLFYC